MPSLHQLHVGSLADVEIDKGVKIAHGSGHVGKRVVIICTGNPPLIIPFCNHLAGFEFDIKGLFVKEPVYHRLCIAGHAERRAFRKRNKRDAMVFRDIYQHLHKRLGQQAFTCRFRKGIKASRIMLLDSSVITLCLSMFNWAHYSEEKGAIKLHTLFSLNDFLPIDVHVSDGKRQRKLFSAKSLSLV